MKPAAKATDDEAIRDQVLQKLLSDPQVRGDWLDVDVKRGVMILTGAVSSTTKKILAVRLAHSIHGALDVVDEIDVVCPGGPARKDEEIARAIRWRLSALPSLDESRIRTTVSDGCVSLEGRVGTCRERDEARFAVRSLPAVRGVINRLAVSSKTREAKGAGA